MLLRVCGIRSVLPLVFCRAFSKEAFTPGAQPMGSLIRPDVQEFLDQLDVIVLEIMAGKHIQNSTDVVDAVPRRMSSPDSFQKMQKMYDGLKTLLEGMGYIVVHKPPVQQISSMHDALIAGLQKQTTLKINELDIDNTLSYIRNCKDDPRLSPCTMASVLAKIADTLARHYHEWNYAIKFCVEAHGCFKNTLDESVKLQVDKARNMGIGSMCNERLGWNSAAYEWAKRAQQILCECMAITSEDTEVLKKVAWIQNQCGIAYYKYATEHSKALGIAYLNTAYSVYNRLQDVESMKQVHENILFTCSETEN